MFNQPTKSVRLFFEFFFKALKTDLTRNILSFGMSCLYRFIAAYFVVMPTLAFMFFFVCVLNDGFVDTFNTTFAQNSVSVMVANACLRWWVTVSLLIFCISWLLFPWASIESQRSSKLTSIKQKATKKINKREVIEEMKFSCAIKENELSSMRFVEIEGDDLAAEVIELTLN